MATPSASSAGSVTPDAGSTNKSRRGPLVGPPVPLPEGEGTLETFEVYAAARYAKRYVLDGYERVSWSCRVQGDYTIDFGVKISLQGGRSAVHCEGHKVGLRGVDKNRVVAEPSRGKEFSGYLDLGDEHLDCLGTRGSADGQVILTLEFDNYFSYFTSKTIELQLAKVSGAAPDPGSFQKAITKCTAKREWESALRLLGRMRSVGVNRSVGCYNAAIRVCMESKQWETTLSLLETMRSESLVPDSVSYSDAITACENSWQAEKALQLMDELHRSAPEDSEPDGSLNDLLHSDSQENLEWIRLALSEALLRCPPQAQNLREHLLAAQGCIVDVPQGGEG